jgi:hypothetical protein
MSSEQRSLRHRVGKHGSGFEKRSDPVSAVFTADARVFESSPGHGVDISEVPESLVLTVGSGRAAGIPLLVSITAVVGLPPFWQQVAVGAGRIMFSAEILITVRGWHHFLSRLR